MALYQLKEADVKISRTCCGTNRVACVVNLTHLIRSIMAHSQPLRKNNLTEYLYHFQHTIWVPMNPEKAENVHVESLERYTFQAPKHNSARCRACKRTKTHFARRVSFISSHLTPPPTVVVASPLSFSSSFLLAFRIISSRRFLSSACLSFLLLLHDCVCGLLPPLSFSAAAADDDDILDERPYRVMRSTCSDLACPGAVLFAAAVGVGGMMGWNDGGGWRLIDRKESANVAPPSHDVHLLAISKAR